MISKTASSKPIENNTAWHRTARLAILLAGVAGYVDAVGYVTLSGLFVSFMSGNTTSAGIALSQGDWTKAVHVGLPIPLFVLGVILGALLVKTSPRAVTFTYGLVALLLALFAALTLVLPQRSGWIGDLATALLVLPMGMLNATLRHVGATSVGLTYVTGTLASLGESLAAVFTKRQVAEAELKASLLASLWLGFGSGATIGGFAIYHWSAWAIAVPVLILLIVSVRTILNPAARPSG